MIDVITTWATAWGIPAQAIADLRQRVAIDATAAAIAASSSDDPKSSENYVQSAIRLEAPKRGYTLWRNNVGALMDDRGVPLRYGLCNDSKKMNEHFKSGDLIGIRKVVITPAMVGQTLGQFASIECKRKDWTYSGNKHEQAQARWATLVNSLGGYAQFIADPDAL